MNVTTYECWLATESYDTCVQIEADSECAAAAEFVARCGIDPDDHDSMAIVYTREFDNPEVVIVHVVIDYKPTLTAYRSDADVN